MKESLFHQVEFPVAPEVIYKAWLNSEQHAAMTGGEAKCTDIEGASFTAWDGYITGVNHKLTPHSKIIQSWRTSEFSDEDEDSLLEVMLEPSEKGCLLSLKHTNIPAGQTQYEQGWIESYFNPMKDYFQS